MKTLITLVPDSLLQFWTTSIDVAQSPLRSRSFLEVDAGGVDADGKKLVELHPLDLDPASGMLIDPLTGRTISEHDVYSISREKAIEPFLDRWVPLPYFAVAAPDRDGNYSYAKGPSNWARARLTAKAEPGGDGSHELTLAFDTSLRPKLDEHYVALTRDDSIQQVEFALAADFRAMSWFLNEDWIGRWLDELFRDMMRKRKNRALTQDDFPYGCEHYARYVTFLGILARSEMLPQVRLIDTESADLPYVPVAVDLVLDVGNSRTCGLLIEEHKGQGQHLADSYPLALRDMGQPSRLHDKPFASRVEFAKALFGNDRLARGSGIANSFAWPSPLRVGPEASRLASALKGSQGATGLSSPKRYLWDERPRAQSWRFNERESAPPHSGIIDSPVSGAVMAHVSEEGKLLEDNKYLQPAFHARFSRSSLFAFMLAEILLQAICQINAPSSRMARREPEKPRQLRRLVLTLPPGMPIFEQQILHARANEALKLSWRLLGWSGSKRSPPMPSIINNLDEATATQIVWLHNETTVSFSGNASALLDTLGRVRPDLGSGQALRIASIDIGGGTTDLMVTTYTLPEGERFEPVQNFRESFKIAGDDLVHQVITAIVLPAFETALKAAGVYAARDMLVRLLAQDLMGQSEQQRQARRVFVSQVLEPVALAVLQSHEKTETGQQQDGYRATVGTILAGDTNALLSAALYLETAAAEAGASGFSVASVDINITAGRVEMAVRAVLGRVIADLCEVIWHYDCDILLLSGRPTRLPAVVDMVLAKLPLPAHRIIRMHHYKVGPHYPFRDGANRIDDPKTTVAVGAMLCVQAEGRLQNFSLPASRFRMRSTARIIGRMDNDGQIRDSNVMLSDADLDESGDVGFHLKFFNNMQLGFRQLPVERWTSTALYQLEFADPEEARKLALPLSVHIKRRDTNPEDKTYEADRERFVVDEITDSDGNTKRQSTLQLRLQTLDDEAGYWRDTGRLNVT